MQMSQTITPKHAIARVKELAASTCGPIGVVNFEFIPLAEQAGAEANWDLAFRPAPSNRHAIDALKAKLIQLAVERVRAEYPIVRWP